MLQAKTVADTLTGARFLLGLYLMWLGLRGGPEAITVAALTLPAAKALLAEKPYLGKAEIKAAISGKLCRCTGHYQMTQAIQMAAQEVTP